MTLVGKDGMWSRKCHHIVSSMFYLVALMITTLRVLPGSEIHLGVAGAGYE